MTSYESIQFRGSANGEIVQTTHTYTEVAPDDVIIKVILSGLCFTDLHMVHRDMCIGHEGVGKVIAIGSAVKNFTVGDRVGWGYCRDTCGQCKLCLTGDDCYCPNADMYGGSSLDCGSLSSITKRKEDWLFKVPDGLRSEDVAPMMCGGATVWSALIQQCKPYDRVGIIGIGGLGHLAIQFAAKLGMEIVVFSSDESKRAEALKLGAHEFYCTKGIKDYGELGVKKTIDVMIITTSAKLHLGILYPVLHPKSIIVPTTVDLGDIEAPHYLLVVTGMQIRGSAISTRFLQMKMMEFAARNDIHVITEKFPMTLEGIKEAYKKLGEGKMRYRGIVSWD